MAYGVKKYYQAMNKSEIIKRLKADNKGDSFLTLRDIRSSLGIGHNTACDLLAETDWLLIGKTRRYLVDDVADAILEKRRRP